MMLSLFNNAFQLYCLQGIKMVGLKDFSVIFFCTFVTRYVRYDNMRNKLPLTQLVHFISLNWQHISTSDCHLQACSIKYINGTAYICMKF